MSLYKPKKKKKKKEKDGVVGAGLSSPISHHLQLEGEKKKEMSLFLLTQQLIIRFLCCPFVIFSMYASCCSLTIVHMLAEEMVRSIIFGNSFLNWP